MDQKTALITGITGQDGSYLADLLIEKGYRVHGVARRTSQFNRGRIENARAAAARRGLVYELHYGDLGDSSSLHRIIAETLPDEVYNLAAQSHVGVSFEQPEYTCDVNANGVLRLLEGVRSNRIDTRFYQASTSELFGKVSQTPQNESTPFYPRSPYAISKLYGYWIVRNYREGYGIHASNGILFNHESPRRGENFVTRKITLGLARIRAGLQRTLTLGNLEAKRDWGHAQDYVKAMWLMLQMDRPDDFVVATGETHSVREFVECAARTAEFEINWEGEGRKEVGRDIKTGNVIVEIDPKFFRPTEVDLLRGDATKAKTRLDWEPKISFEELVNGMVKADLDLYRKR